jgi:hypothetical protein
MNMVQTSWRDLCNRDLTRKEFLSFVGIAPFLVLNMESLLRLVSLRSTASPDQLSSYGSTQKGRG